RHNAILESARRPVKGDGTCHPYPFALGVRVVEPTMVYRGVMGLAPDLVERFARAADVIREPEQLRTYECDGLTGRRVVPALVALPADAAQVQAVVRICNDAGVPFVARGAGTGLSGGALPVAEGIVISLARMDRVLAVDIDAGEVVV